MAKLSLYIGSSYKAVLGIARLGNQKFSEGIGQDPPLPFPGIGIGSLV